MQIILTQEEYDALKKEGTALRSEFRNRVQKFVTSRISARHLPGRGGPESVGPVHELLGSARFETTKEFTDRTWVNLSELIDVLHE